MMRPFPAAAPASFSRRRLGLLVPQLLGLLAVAGPRDAGAATLPTPQSLAAELDAALRAGLPLVVMASLEGCPYCKMVRDHYLAPLRRDTGQPVVQLDMGSQQAVRDFKSNATTHHRILGAWGIGAAPTVLFFGALGHESAARLVGASIPDFYGAYLDERVRTARASI